MTPLTHPIDQMDSENIDVGQSYMFKKKFINQPKLLEGKQPGTKNDALDPSSLGLDVVKRQVQSILLGISGSKETDLKIQKFLQSMSKNMKEDFSLNKMFVPPILFFSSIYLSFSVNIQKELYYYQSRLKYLSTNCSALSKRAT